MPNITPRIPSDPGLETAPDYTTAEWQTARDRLIAKFTINDQEAADELAASWKFDNDAQKLKWDAQVAADLAQAQRTPSPPPQIPPKSPDKKNEPEIDDSIPIPHNDGLRVSAFAELKLKLKEYAPIWYWSREGCAEASSLFRVDNHETIGLVQDEDGISLQKVSKGSGKVVQDEDLTWEQLSVAKGNFLTSILESPEWSSNYRLMFSQFYFNLDIHPIGRQPFGREALIAYHAAVRRRWFDAFKQSKTADAGTKTKVFNIATLDEGQLAKLQLNAKCLATSKERKQLPNRFP